MAKKRLKDFTKVVAGKLDSIVAFNPIPNNKTIKITLFGAADINMGDNKSSVWILQWGKTGDWNILRILSLTGTTQDLKLKESLIGDGVKSLRVVRKNYSSTEKELPFWIEGEEG